MEFIDLAKKRASVRAYQETPVAEALVAQILEAAHVAPTAANLQPVRLLAVRTPEGLEKLGRAANLYGAPLAIVVCADRDKSWVRPFDNKNVAEIDATILTDHMMLQAEALGLHSVWICYFKPDVLRAAFQLPDSWEPVNILAIGHSDEPPADPARHAHTRVGIDTITTYC